MSEKFDYTLLLERIEKYRYNLKTLSESMPISRTSLYSKLNGEVNFTQTDIRKICFLLEIPGDDIGEYFFTTKTRESEL